MRDAERHVLRVAPVEERDGERAVGVGDCPGAERVVGGHPRQDAPAAPEELGEPAHRVEVGVGGVVVPLVIPAEETPLVVAQVAAHAAVFLQLLLCAFSRRLAARPAEGWVGIVAERPAYGRHETSVHGGEPHFRAGHCGNGGLGGMAGRVAAVVVHHAIASALGARRRASLEAELAKGHAAVLELAFHHAHHVPEERAPSTVVAGIACGRLPVVEVPAVGVGNVIQRSHRRLDVLQALGTALVGVHQPDVEAVAAEGAEHCAVEVAENLPAVAAVEVRLPEPVVNRPHRTLVRHGEVGDARAAAPIYDVFEVAGRRLGVGFAVEVLHNRRHPARDGVNGGAALAEGGVIPVGEAVHRLLRPVGEAREDAGIGRRDFEEAFQRPLVAELLGHEARHLGLGVVEAEAPPQPPQRRLGEDDFFHWQSFVDYRI